MLWEESVMVSLISYSSNHMDTIIRWSEEETEWRFTRIYGWPEAQNKHKTCEMLADLSPDLDLSWMVGGDLNSYSQTSKYST